MKIEGRKAFKKLLMDHQQGKSDSSNFCAATICAYVCPQQWDKECVVCPENSLVTDDLDLDLKSDGAMITTKEFRKSFYVMSNLMYV